ncbi:hypothetical protein E5329_10380 [Petralouisia muris]|uniref:Uncharacterized protein n=1 Tax=Petralouisia muris TaxID=3032872 RepID=A0AC61RWD4_9FIRM|nr:hypothetical protein [Petralouisia muris]TGY96247.1 hypothetical protein E5329_10380 [Petralouisia muris]
MEENRVEREEKIEENRIEGEEKTEENRGERGEKAEENRVEREENRRETKENRIGKAGSFSELKNFTPGKFLNTGQEMLIELRASFYTTRGKLGLLLFLIGIIWGFGEVTGEEPEPFVLAAALMWVAMGLAMLVTLENNKLLYLLPVTRKEFAAIQIRRMAWIFLLILGVITLFLACMKQNPDFFWRNFFLKAIPFSGAMSIYAIAAIKPVKESQQTGHKIYQLSNAVILLVVVGCLLNFIVFWDSWNVLDWILSAADYGVNIFTLGYLYWKFGCADVYYDEI